jgi:hypothetical protein
MITQQEAQNLYGEHARVTQVEGFSLVHLDRPTTETMEKRARDFDPAVYFHGFPGNPPRFGG